MFGGTLSLAQPCYKTPPGRKNAAYVNAEAALTLAKAETEKANARFQNAQAALEEERVKQEEAQTEVEKAEAAQRIAEIQQQMEEEALRHQGAMVRLANSLLEAERAYELALAEVKIARQTLSSEDRVKLSALELVADEKEQALEDAMKDLADAEEAYYNAVLDARVDAEIGEVAIVRLENAVVAAQNSVANSKAVLAKWQGYLSNETETADWRAEITAIEDSIVKLDKEVAALELERVKKTEADDYKALKAETDKTAKAFNEFKTGAKYEVAKIQNGDATYTAATSVAKGTAAVDAMKKIAGPDMDGKGGFIADYKNLIAGYTTEKKQLLSEIAAATEGDVAKQLEAATKAKADWTAAKTAYESVLTTAKDISSDAIYVKNTTTGKETGAFVTFTEAMDETVSMTGDAKAKAILKAEQAFADALVAFYNTVPADQAAMNNVTLELTVGGKDVLITKTIKDWLSDSANKDVYLNSIMAYFGMTCDATLANVNKWSVLWSMVDDTKDKVENNNVTQHATGAYNTWLTKQQLIDAKLAALKTASTAAFGDAVLYKNADGSNSSLNTQENGYMHVEPTQAEMKAVGYAGAVGKYYAMTDANYKYEAANYETIIAAYEAAVTYWTAAFTEINTGRTAAYNAAVAAAKAQEAYEKANFSVIDNKIAAIGDTKGSLEKIKTALIKAVDAFLAEDYNGVQEFNQFLNQKVAQAAAAVLTAEEKLDEAEIALEKAKDGKYDALTEAQADLDAAMEAVEKAKAEFEEAMEDLETALAIMAELKGSVEE